MKKPIENPLLPSREKYWDECDSGQHVERLRETLVRQELVIERLERALVQLEQHRHDDKTGALTVQYSSVISGNSPLGYMAGGGSYRSYRLNHGKPND